MMNSMVSSVSIPGGVSLKSHHSSQPPLQGTTEWTEMKAKRKSTAQNRNHIRKQSHSCRSSPFCIQSSIGSLLYWSRYETRESSQRREISTKYLCPTWISYRAWAVRYLSETWSGWKFHFVTYRVLPRNHGMFMFAKTGDITSLQRMLASGQGYVTDRQASCGWTTLHVSQGYVAKNKY
jgi:hypothetical protein